MPIDYRYDADVGILYGSISGTVTADEIETEMRSMLTSGDFPSDASTLWDMRRLDFSSIDRELEMQLISLRSRHPERGAARLALVVGDELGLGMARMYELMSSDLPQHIRVFQTFEAGERWLKDGRDAGHRRRP